MSPKTILRMAKPLRARIDARVLIIGQQVDTETYQRARADSDEAVSLAKYLIMHLDNRHDAGAKGLGHAKDCFGAHVVCS